MAVYAEYRLWYVTLDVIPLARELDVGISAALGSGTNVRKCLKLLAIIESTLFEQLYSSWRECTSPSIDHHPGGAGAGYDFVYYDTWQQ